MSVAAAPEIWRVGRLSGRVRGGRPRLLFGNQYEDAAIELAAFRGRRRVFCIASAGVTAMTLAADSDTEGRSVVACDINPAQVAYGRRRAAGGAAERGEAERMMGWLRALLPAVGWRRGVLREFLALDDLAEQRACWRRHLDTRRFRWACDQVLSPRWLRAYYSSSLLKSLPMNFGAQLRGRMEAGFGRFPNASNPYTRALLLGEAVAAPEAPAGSIEFVAGDAAAWLEGAPAGSFDGFTLSNILDGATAGYRVRLLAAVGRAARPGAVVIWRSFAASPAGIGRDLAGQDRSMLWATVQAGPVTDFGAGTMAPVRG